MVPFGGRSERNGTNGLLGQRDCSSGKSKADDIRLILGTYVKPDVVLHICISKYSEMEGGDERIFWKLPGLLA